MLPSASNWEAIMTAMTCLCASTTKNGVDNNFITSLTQQLNHQYPNETRVCIKPEELQEMQTKIDILADGFTQLQAQQVKMLAEIKRVKTPTFCIESEGYTDPDQFITREIRVPEFSEPIEVVCNGDWLIIAVRMKGGINFHRSWKDYKKGFGLREGEFFIGLEKLHILTKSKPYQLQIRLTDFDNDERTAFYDRFEIGSEAEGYSLKNLGSYTGTAGDSLLLHRGQKFSTFDRDNDMNHFDSCAELNAGAWWYANDPCHESNLFGPYSATAQQPSGRGIIWNTFRGMDYSLKEVIMLIRPSKKCH